jgi:hypothetical protein
MAKKKTKRKAPAKKASSKKAPAKKASSKKPPAKRKRVRPPFMEERMISLGIQLTSARHTYQDVMDEIEEKAPGMKNMLRQLQAVIHYQFVAESMLVGYIQKFYPNARFPVTLAPRKNLPRRKP